MIVGMPKKACCLFLILTAFLHMGVVRRKSTAVQKTQQESISFKKKMEETKDGVKGAPTPSFQFYKKEEFLTDSPMKTSGEAAAVPEDESAFESTEVEEDAGWDEAPDEENEDWWVEESGEESGKEEPF